MIVDYAVFSVRMLASTLAVYVVVFVLLSGWPSWLMLWAVVLAALGHAFALRREVRFRALYEAHWASEREVSPLKVSFPLHDGVMLGFAYGNVFGLRPGAFGQRELGHVLVCGPSRSGKGLHLTSNLLSWRHSAVVVDIKGELYRLTAGHRVAMGQRVVVLNPTGDGHRFDPFRELSTDEAIRSVVTIILDPDADGSNAAFARRATFALFAAVKAALVLSQPVLPFVRRVTARGLEGFCRELWHVEDASVREALVDFLREDPTRFDWSSVAGNKYLDNTWTGMLTKLQPLFSEGILRMTSASDFRAVDLVREGVTVYLVFQESELEYTGVAFRTVLLAMINTLIRHYDLHPDEVTLPLLFGFDEAGRLAIPKLPDLVSTVAGRGMTALIYVQSISQLDGAYGEAGRATILDNTHTKVFYRPKDSGTAEYVAQKCGQLMAEDLRNSDGMEGRVQQAVGVRPRELVTADELQLWPVERCVVLTELPPVAAHRLAPWLLPGGREALALPPPWLPRFEFETADVHLPSEVPGGPSGERPEIPAARQAPQDDGLVELE
ncbi:type IV secretory system conjugative DNA transfer family protein [Deinococcus pimensis]|uniref:type IV secretory system conjugative DNA transfer family protein n=1 Tax=Deinococcus pimensis TaxID=309888 RepID=UPI00048513DB|nr:type IV secretory system conjugative DNA transfer family protein [Deinococcus pimensis]